MSGFVCPHCGEVTYIFMKDGGKSIAETLSLNFLGAVPLNPAICEAGDIGNPAVLTDKSVKEVFISLVEKMNEQLN